jgi:hypothetical protein
MTAQSFMTESSNAAEYKRGDRLGCVVFWRALWPGHPRPQPSLGTFGLVR